MCVRESGWMEEEEALRPNPTRHCWSAIVSSNVSSNVATEAAVKEGQKSWCPYPRCRVMTMSLQFLAQETTERVSP